MAGSYRVDYIELPSADGAGTRAFFETAFGWNVTSYGPGYAAIDDAGIDTGIDSQPDRVAAPLATVRAEDLDEAERRVVAAGGTITRSQFDFPGGRRFHFREPGGNEMAVWVTREA